MASGTFKWYGPALMHLYGGDIDFSTDVLKVLMTTASYIPSQDTDELVADVNTHEVTGIGYTAGGITLTHSVSWDSTNALARIVANDVTWTSSTISGVQHVVVYIASGVPGTSYVLGYATLSATASSENGDFTLDFDNTNGILYLDAS